MEKALANEIREYPKIAYPCKPIIFLMGPTASGKTALATDIYQKEKVEIISVDSALVFSEMDIGTATPSKSELLKAPHHLIDFVDPKDSYSASSFCEDATRIINSIHEKGKTPLLVGGTMLYFKALKEGLAELPPTQQEVREKIKRQLEEQGLEFLHKRLAKVDPVTAQRLHANDTQRITRAIEVFEMTHKPLSQWHSEQQEKALPNPIFSIALAPNDRKILHTRIASRFEQMLNAGFLIEVKKLYQRGDLSLDCPSMRSVGYRQFWKHLNGELTFEEAKEKAIIATRQLAKRQYTWLRSWPDVYWFDSLNSDELKQCETQISEYIKNHKITE